MVPALPGEDSKLKISEEKHSAELAELREAEVKVNMKNVDNFWLVYLSDSTDPED